MLTRELSPLGGYLPKVAEVTVLTVWNLECDKDFFQNNLIKKASRLFFKFVCIQFQSYMQDLGIQFHTVSVTIQMKEFPQVLLSLVSIQLLAFLSLSPLQPYRNSCG